MKFYNLIIKKEVSNILAITKVAKSLDLDEMNPRILLEARKDITGVDRFLSLHWPQVRCQMTREQQIWQFFLRKASELCELIVNVNGKAE